MAEAAVLDQLAADADGSPAVTSLILSLALPPALFFFFILLRRLRYDFTGAWSNREEPNSRLPPSPPAMPLIGHLHHLIAGGGLPHVSLRDLAAQQQQQHNGGEGLMLLRLGAVPTLVVSSAGAAQAILRTHDAAFASRPRSAVGDILAYGPSGVGFAPYGERWRRAKKLVATHLLAAGKVHSPSHHAAREEEVSAAVARIRGAAAAGHAAVDMSELLSSFTSGVLCRAVAGRSLKEECRRRVFRELIDAGMALVGGFSLENFYPRLAEAAGGVLTWPARRRAQRLRDQWDKIFDALIDEHEREMVVVSAGGGDGDLQETDFIHVLLSVQDEYGLTRNSIKGILADMFTAGIDTTYLVLEFAMAELMLNQESRDKLQAELRKLFPKGQEIIREESLIGMTYLKAVIKETLRLHPPTPLLVPHLCIEECDVGNYTIPTGTTVFINAWAIGRDPNTWNAPEKFMPERFIDKRDLGCVDFRGNDFQFLPFGSGRRICPGINFAIASIEIMLANLMCHFDWEPSNGMHNIDMTEVFGLTVRRKEKLILVPSGGV